MKKILFIILSFMYLTDVNALTICEESELHKKWKNLNEEERLKYFEPEYCQEEKEKINYYCVRGANDTYYSSVDLGLVTSPKNQGNTNACWAFSGVSLLETSALKNNYSELDLSERHINILSTYDAYLNNEKNLSGYNRELNDGGNYSYVASYLFRGDGPILEKDFPYIMPWSSNYARLDKSTMPTNKSLLTIDEYIHDYTSDGCSSDRLNDIKKYIREYGSVGVTISTENGISTERDFYYINTVDQYTDHAVTLVGYDDSISKEYFIGATRDGAFIVKNSWGTQYANGGYFYISYDDALVCNNITAFKGAKNNDYDFTYNASDTVANVTSYNNGTIYLSTKLSVTEEIYLDKVSIEVVQNAPYEVYLSKNNDLTNSSNWTLLGSGINATDGVISVKFNKILLTSDATIIVKINQSGYSIPLMCKETTTGGRNYYTEISSNKNYYSLDGINWFDASTITNGAYNGCEPVIYAYAYKKNKTFGTIDNIYLSKTSQKVYIKSDDYFVIDFLTSNINYKELISIKITKDNKDVKKDFNLVTNNINNNYFYIKLKDTTKSGTYKVTINYNDSSKSIDFVVYDKISSNVFQIDGNYIKILPKKDIMLNKEYIINNIIHEGNIGIKRNNNILTNETILSKDILFNDDQEYTLILIGDANMDGKITPLDYIKIKNHILGNKVISDEINLIGADANDDGDITPLDYIRIKNRIMKGEV